MRSPGRRGGHRSGEYRGAHQRYPARETYRQHIDRIEQEGYRDGKSGFDQGQRYPARSIEMYHYNRGYEVGRKERSGKVSG